MLEPRVPATQSAIRLMLRAAEAQLKRMLTNQPSGFDGLRGGRFKSCAGDVGKEL